jgi:hypothetical protein
MSVKTSTGHEADTHQEPTLSLASDAHLPRKVLVIDIGGTSIKLLVSGQRERRMLPSGRKRRRARW